MQKHTSINIYKTARRLYKLHALLKRQQQYIHNHLPPLLRTLEAGQPEKFCDASIKRFSKYWQLGLNVVCNSLYLLMGKKLSEDEQHRILLLSVFGPLYDDLFDENLLHLEKIETFTLAPEKHHPCGFKEYAARAVYLRILELAPHREKVIEHLHRVFTWQKASLRQMCADVGEEELYQITYKKSYYSILLYYSVLDHYPSEDVRKMLYPMAGLLQLTNDAFDVYKDLGSGIYTVPNLYLNFDKIQQRFLSDVALFNHSLAKLPFLQQAKNTYGITIHALHAMGWMALSQLKEIARGIDDPQVLATLGRKALVCDMDNLRQKAKWVKQVKNLVNYQ